MGRAELECEDRTGVHTPDTFTQPQTHTHTDISIYRHKYIYIYIYIWTYTFKKLVFKNTQYNYLLIGTSDDCDVYRTMSGNF